MKPPSEPMGPFLKGYRQQEQQMPDQQVPHRLQATEVLDLFARKKVQHMTMFEISSELVIRPQEAASFVKELASRNLVSIESASGGNDLVQLTKRGKLYIMEE